MNERLRAELHRVAAALGSDDEEGEGAGSFVLERPRDPGHGDLATNLALVLAKRRRASPRAVAQQVVDALALPPGLVDRIEIAGPGFINFWLSRVALAEALAEICRAGEAYGRNAMGAGRRVNVEFVSANPTGPLHVGHGRGAALGDAIAALLEWTGHAVTREFYINDAGVQIDRLAESLWARVQEASGTPAPIPEGGYHGEYLAELAREVLAQEGEDFARLPRREGIARCRALALAAERKEQDELLRDLRVHFAAWTSEQALYDTGKVEATVQELIARGLTFEEEGALWLRTSTFGDDKDRVLRKSDGAYTYVVPDIAYHRDKHQRGFDLAIDVWGADHHGYIPRMRAVLRALGYPDAFFEVNVVQLVKVVRGTEEVKMSKRAGDFITLRDLVDEVGVDAARYFFLMRRSDAQFTFDVDLATRQTDENPVFYVQMAHARMSGIFRVAGRDPESVEPTPVESGALPDALDQDLLKKLTQFPEIVARAAREREPHQITGYLEELARLVHAWYHQCRVLGEPPVVEAARLALARAARIVLRNGLTLLGLTAPERM